MNQARHAGATLLDSPTLVVKQKLKLIELKNEYEVYGPDGRQLGRVVQVRQSPLALFTRIFSDLDVALPIHLELRDAAGGVLLHLSKPWFRWAVGVSRPDGTPVGSIAKQYRMGKARFRLTDPSGRPPARLRRATGGPRTSASSTPRATKSARSTRSSPACASCSPTPTTTWSASTRAPRSRCAAW